MTTGGPPGRVCFVLQDVQNGGVERCFLNLARGFTERGIAVDMLVRHLPAELAEQVSSAVNLVTLGGRGDQLTAAAFALSTGEPPSALVAAQEGDARLALSLRERIGSPAVLVASLDYTGQLDGRGVGPLRRWMRYRSLRRLYGAADKVFCVSHGVAEDMERILGSAAPPLSVLPNPVVLPELQRLVDAPLSHPWFADNEPPVVLGVGRLSLIKNFPLLVHAFSRLRQTTEARLMILGEGKQRALLLALAEQLGIADSVALPGHVANPYAYMAHARLFVLSSLWEGFGNVLVEALACGTPVVATDCRSGPAEILDGGRFGPLVPVANESALAEAMQRTLARPPPVDLLRRAAQPYSLEASTSAYLSALGLVD